MRTHSVAIACALLAAGVFWTDAGAQYSATYSRGQDVSPTFDGWEQNPDGSYTFYFGYFNRNSEEELTVPIGPNNTFDVGGDRGQPTHFYPSRKWWVFKTVVPADWPKERRLVWTLTTHGKTNQAKGWLQPEWEVDQKLIAKNAARDPSLMTNSTNQLDMDDDNRPPDVTIAPSQATATVSSGLALAATAMDDGRPTPVPDPEGRLQQGVRVRWILYRGPGAVRFDPDIMSGRVHGRPATLTTTVTFTTPGDYRLRAIASDGQAFATRDVDVTVR